jgi:hypothetical protein
MIRSSPSGHAMPDIGLNDNGLLWSGHLNFPLCIARAVLVDCRPNSEVEHSVLHIAVIQGVICVPPSFGLMQVADVRVPA